MIRTSVVLIAVAVAVVIVVVVVVVTAPGRHETGIDVSVRQVRVGDPVRFGIQITG
jgi:hypothetical protein